MHSKNVFKSIGAVLAGFVVSALLSTLTDLALETTGVIAGPQEGLFITWMIVLVLFYRSIYTVLAGVVVERLAPQQPLAHAAVLGVVGIVLTILGTHAKSDLAPLWFGYTLAVLTLPSLWLGVKIARSWRA